MNIAQDGNDETMLRLPVHPGVVSRAHSILAGRDRQGIERLVWMDPGLAVAVLGAAYAEHGSGQGRIGGLRQATVLVGHTAVRGIIASRVLAASVEERFEYPDWLWTHSLLVAASCGVLARRCGVNADEAYTSGLIHDAGWLADLDDGMTVPARDRKHAERTATAFAQIGLTAGLCDAVRAHHDLVDPGVPVATRVLIAGHAFANEMGGGGNEAAISAIEALHVLRINARVPVIRNEIEAEVGPLLKALEGTP